MKKHTYLWVIIWTLLFLAFVSIAGTLFAQDTSSVRRCPCDSNFTRRVNYRIERQLEVNGTFWSALQDQKQINAVLENRLDSLFALVRTRQERQQQPKKRK